MDGAGLEIAVILAYHGFVELIRTWRSIMLKDYRFLPRTIFSRLFVTFLCILLPLVAISVGIQVLGMSIIRTEILGSMKSRMDFRKINLDAELDRIQSYMIDTLSDVDLLKLANIPGILGDFEKVQAMNRVQSRLIAYRNSSIYIDDVQILLNTLSRSISANDGVSLMTDAERSIILASTAPDLSFFLMEQEKLYLRGRNLVLANKPSTPQFVIQVVFSNDSMKNAFTQQNSLDGRGALLYFPDKGYSVTTDMYNPVVLDIERTIDQDRSLASFDKTVQVDAIQYLVVCTKLESHDIWLAEYIPSKEVFSPLDKYGYLLWLFAILSLGILVFSLSLDQENHSPAAPQLGGCLPSRRER